MSSSRTRVRIVNVLSMVGVSVTSSCRAVVLRDVRWAQILTRQAALLPVAIGKQILTSLLHDRLKWPLGPRRLSILVLILFLCNIRRLLVLRLKCRLTSCGPLEHMTALLLCYNCIEIIGLVSRCRCMIVLILVIVRGLLAVSLVCRRGLTIYVRVRRVVIVVLCMDLLLVMPWVI